MNEYENTHLWKILQDKTDESSKLIRRHLPEILEAAETILRSAQTGPSDFTLHDDQHAIRVAQKMVEIIPKETLTGLSGYELAFLLLAAYVHDIGMTPTQNQTSKHWDYLMYGPRPEANESRAGLSDAEKEELEDWLDTLREEVDIPAAEDGKPTRQQLAQVSNLIAHYSRHKHADWCADWLTSTTKHLPLGTFSNWKEYLVLLCKSHQADSKTLLHEKYDPILSDNNGNILHLRYLACILRVADVLDVDPKRTPDIVLNHREINDSSNVYWKKDHHISIAIQNNQISIYSRPEKAYLQKAINETADQIENELNNTDIINRKRQFSHSELPNPLCHQWRISSRLRRNIEPKTNTYEYIDGTFRPSPERLMELLSGHFLYNEELTAIRELLLNAFDATAKRDAQELLHQKLLSPQIDTQQQPNRRVVLNITRIDNRIWIECTDEGIGMTKEVIGNSLLVSGNEKDRYTRKLKRQCKQYNISMHTAGEYGIGVLSYFSISDKAIITTRRLQGIPDEEGTGWQFETLGIGSFGELRKSDKQTAGTTVRLRLRQDFDIEPEEIFKEIEQYLYDTFTKIPFDLYLTSDIEEMQQSHMKNGWLPNKEIEEEIRPLKQLHSDHIRFRNHLEEELYTKSESQEAKDIRQNYLDSTKEFFEKINWREETDELPDGMGTYRIRIPYFEYPDGKCLAFIRPQSNAGKKNLLPIGKGNIRLTHFHDAVLSWHGIKASHEFDSFTRSDHLGHITLDFTKVSGACIDLSRDTITELTYAGLDAYHEVCDRAREIAHEMTPGGDYESINTRLHQIKTLDGTCEKWFKQEEDEDHSCWEWTSVKYPVTEMNFATWFAPAIIESKKPNIAILSPFKSQEDEYATESNIFWHTNYPPDKLVIHDTALNRGYLVPVWTGDNLSRQLPLGPSMHFPQGWEQVTCLSYFMRSFQFMGDTVERIVNSNNPIIKAVSLADVDDYENEPTAFSFSKDFLDSLLTSPGKAGTWIVNELLTSLHIGRWTNIVERYPEYPQKLWNTLFQNIEPQNQPGHIISLQLSGTYWSINVLKKDSHNTYNWPNDKREIRKFLPVQATEPSRSKASNVTIDKKKL